MRRFGILCLGALVSLAGVSATASPAMKEWTYLIFMDGNNNLDSFTELNLRQLETVGSTKDINIVVQWASAASDVTKRLLVTKSTHADQVTSPVVQSLPRVDMGDPRQLVDFVQWTVLNYPARHYFLSMWDHGGGWHQANASLVFHPLDISFDQFTGHWINTPQFGEAMASAAKIMGHKVDLVGSDACLMAMAEVGDEMADSVKVAIASEEEEPGLGWPYDKLMESWAAKPTSTPAEISRVLTAAYIKSFQTGDGSEVTLSSVDLTQSDALDTALSDLARKITRLPSADLAKLRDLIPGTQNFGSEDYYDISDFAARLAEAGINGLDPVSLAPLRQAIKAYVIDNQVTGKFAKAKGVSLWIPYTKSAYSTYSARYQALKFPARTGWNRALEAIVKDGH